MKNGLNKFAKGMFAIITIKLILISIVLVIQSCTQESFVVDENLTVAKNTFLESIAKTRNKFNNVSVTKNNLKITHLRKGNVLPESSMFVKTTNNNLDIGMDNLGDVSDKLVEGEIELILNPSEIDLLNERVIAIEVSEDDVEEALSTSINASKEYLNSYGFTESEISEILVGQDESLLIQLVHANITILNEREGVANNMIDKKFIDTLFGIQSAHAQITWGEVGGCAAAAIGIDIIHDLRSETAGKKMTKKVLGKAFKKVATKVASYLTGFGLAWTAVYFVGCLALSY